MATPKCPTKWFRWLGALCVHGKFVKREGLKAFSVPREYHNRAVALDHRLAGAGFPTGVAEILAEYERQGTISGLCFGTFNEGGPGFEKLLHAIVDEASESWRHAGAESQADMRSWLTNKLYGEWGAAFANANAEIRLRALETVGQSGRRVDAHGVPQDGGMMRDYADRTPVDTGGAAGAMPARHER